LKSKTVRPASLSTLPSAYDDFLYAPVGESTNGASLTVLSVLARQNIDPWEEAADLSRMPHANAARRLISMITVSPGQSSSEAAVADRLIALLPGRGAERAPDALQGEAAVRRSPSAVNWMVIAIYIAVVVVSQWIATSIFEKPAPGVAPVPSSLADGRETPPSSEAQ
jgi:hypothetical protein